MIGRVICLSILLLGTTLARAQLQPDSLQSDTSDVYRSLTPMLDDFPSDQDASAQIVEQLAGLAEHPLNVNQASASSLAQLPMFTPTIARRIVRFREQNGPFDDVGGLLVVEGVSPPLLNSAHPYITARASTPTSDSSQSPPSFSKILSDLDLQIIQRYTRHLDLGQGYNEDPSSTSFLGSPSGLTTRLRLSYERRAELALTLDQDPGEPFRWRPDRATYGFDHVAGSLVLRDIGPLETFVVGDFTPRFGQGVALWRGMSFGKGRDPVAPLLRSGRGIVPFRSAAESDYFRGTAATIGLPKNFSASAFVSNRRRDASLDSSRSARETTPFSRTISKGGYHRTPGEIRRKGTFAETTIGGALEYHHPSFHLGITGHQSWFEHPLRPENQPYRQFHVSGRRTAMISTYANAYLGNYVLFGEIGRSPRNALGGVAGAAFEKHSVQVLLQGRHYPPEFASHHGQAFGEGGGSPHNEQGVYLGLRMRVAANWRLGAYFDQFRFPWLRFNVPRPTTGKEGRFLLEYEPRPWLSSYLQFRTQSREEGTQYSVQDRRLEGVSPERRQSVRWHTEYTFSSVLTLRTRLEGSRYSSKNGSENGFLLSQGFRFRPSSSLRLDARLAFFDTDGYDSRIYAYEHDLLYSFSVPVFFERGRRSYLLVQYEPTSSVVLEAKFGVLRYANLSTVGSGLNEVASPQRREIGLQVRWNL